MGYTHHWYRKPALDKKKFARAVADCQKVCAASKVPLENSKFSAGVVAFDAYETFIVEQVSSGRIVREGLRKGKVFEFCKTAHCNADICVTACLIVFKHHFGDDFIVLSDGDDDAFNGARPLCQETLDYGSEFKVDPQEVL
jgi:hypothetical protein